MRTLTGMAAIPSEMFGPPGIGMEDTVNPTPPIMIQAELAWTPNRRTAGSPRQSSMKDTTKMRSIEMTIHTLPDAIPFGNTGFAG
jgi:hypothetical protein